MNEPFTKESFKVHGDILVDVFAIIIRYGITYDVFRAEENQNVVHIALSYQKDISSNLEGIKAVREVIEFYDDYRSSENEDLN